MMRRALALLFCLLAGSAHAATEKWIGGSGQGLTWGSAFASGDVNQASFVTGDTVLSTTTISNGTPLDMFMDVSCNFASWGATSATPTFGIYLYPLQQDGTTYGDGQLTAGTLAAYVPSGTLLVAIGGVKASATAAQAVYFRNALTGMPLLLPPGTFKLALYNSSGATLATTGNACSYRTYNRQVQ